MSLYSGERLVDGGWLRCGRLLLQMRTDCNPVLHDAGRTLWASDTAGSGISCYLCMQHDSNLVMYTSDGHDVVWQSYTRREQGNYALVLQRDRNLVICGPVLWATSTIVLAAAGVVVTQKSTSAVGKPKNKSISIHGE
ncbi:hypothetical protein MUK42_16873 [Musa troglodytarum]|nr:hypothetical protein MUK42_16873 [Musa troglodytarum]